MLCFYLPQQLLHRPLPLTLSPRFVPHLGSHHRDNTDDLRLRCKPVRI
jgi:hypothetical protein